MKFVKKIGALLALAMVLTAVASPLLGQEKKQSEIDYAKAEASKHGTVLTGPGIGGGIGAGLVIIGAAIGFGRIGAAALESMARQPETAGRVQTAMIIIGALLEGATFFALIICMQIGGKS